MKQILIFLLMVFSLVSCNEADEKTEARLIELETKNAQMEQALSQYIDSVNAELNIILELNETLVTEINKLQTSYNQLQADFSEQKEFNRWTRVMAVEATEDTWRLSNFYWELKNSE